VTFRIDLPVTPPDEVSFPWLRLLGALEAAHTDGRDRMYEVEALQIYEQSLDLQRITGGADYRKDPLDPLTLKHLIAGLAASPYTSKALREHLLELARRV
jgi:hypothetical protein